MTRNKVDTVKNGFIAMYSQPEVRGNVSLCCKSLKVPRATFYKWMKEDEEFAAAIHESDEEIQDDMEQVLLSRAVDNSDASLIFWLKMRHPKYKPQPTTLVQVNNTTVPVNDEQLARIIS